jgi:type VI secretion system secreted protein Hcp
MDVLILDCGTDIEGESTMDGYAKKIEILSFSHGVAQQITGDQSNQKRTSGKPNHQDFTVTKYVDLASCGLIDFCNQAKNLASVKIALVSSVSVGGGGGGKPQETVTFNYTKIQWDYKQQASAVSDSGKNSAKWSLETNKAE